CARGVIYYYGSSYGDAMDYW
nr:immunoglobulin heavy chain junction region [Mus musculus]MBK4185617.1 immunoglobulin heavy chain junction region [Mus musculus]MBK4185618.1 immunoglobulin heavy chain junction region [Mus musculus]MBK4185624.1 immunoglobulin heavy chain junction region [Mus musculus]MBK4185625.1 immunoglobulin heavy chain junction region [Mus musculus]